MAGISMEIKITDSGVEKQLNELLAKMERPSGFYKNVGEHIQKVTPERFEREEAPDGSKWERLSPVTVASRLKRNGNSPLTIYREKGDFFSSINYQASDDNFRWGSNDVRARIFQLGGQAGRGNSVTLPARPYIGLSPDDENEILEIAKDWVAL